MFWDAHTDTRTDEQDKNSMPPATWVFFGTRPIDERLEWRRSATTESKSDNFVVSSTAALVSLA